MFEEYACGCIFSLFQGRVRVCPAHRTYTNEDRIKVILDPTGRIVRLYPANGRGVEGWTGK